MEARPSWDEYGLGLAEAAATRADCRRRKVGAAVLDKDHRTVATGYNGAPSGKPGCLSGACPRGLLSYEAQPAGGSYGNCISIHAEANALLYAPRHSLVGGTIYITDAPCDDCFKLICASGIEWIKYPNGGVKVG